MTWKRFGLGRAGGWLLVGGVVAGLAWFMGVEGLSKIPRAPRKLWLIMAGRDSRCGVLRSVVDQSFSYFRLTVRRPRVVTIGRDGSLILTNTSLGRFWMPASDTPAATICQELAEEEYGLYGKGEWGVQPGDVVLDCGAHIGTFTRAALARGARQVVAIEPLPIAQECLRRNLSAEMAAGRVVLCPKGVWDRESTLELKLERGNTGASSVVLDRGGGSAVTVPLTTIDKLVRDLRLERVDFIKMDIEGAEVPALIGARETLRRFRPRLAIAVYHREGDLVGVQQAVLEAAQGWAVRGSMCLENYDRIRPQVLLFRPDGSAR